MARTLEYLTPATAEKVRKIIDLCAKDRVELLVYCTLRTPEEQARAYRQSRTSMQIQHKAEQLTMRGYPMLAEILMGVGPCKGKLGYHITNAAPGESWHQYGEAFDAVPIVDGKCCWDTVQHAGLWRVYTLACEAMGMYPGASYKDFPHCQRYKLSPLHVFAPDDIAQHLIRGYTDATN